MNRGNQNYTSKEHENLVNIVLKLFGGTKTVIKGNQTIKGMYFPDVKTEENDIEVEILPKSYLKKKVDKWKNGKNKILVCGFSKFALDNFKEIWIHKENGLIRVV